MDRLNNSTTKHTLLVVTAVAIFTGLALGLVGYYFVSAKLEKDRLVEEDKKAARELQERMARTEFQTESAKPLKYVQLIVKLNRLYSSVELGHFRVLFEIADHFESDKHAALLVGCKDYHVQATKAEAWKRVGQECQTWSRQPNKNSPTYRSTHGAGATGFDFGASLFEFGIRPFQTMDNIDETVLNIYVTEPFLKMIERITLRTNDYDLISEPSSEFSLSDASPADWKLPLSDVEKQVPWKRIDLKQKGEVLEYFKKNAKSLKEAGIEGIPPAPWQLDFKFLKPHKVKYDE